MKTTDFVLKKIFADISLLSVILNSYTNLFCQLLSLFFIKTTLQGAHLAQMENSLERAISWRCKHIMIILKEFTIHTPNVSQMLLDV